MLFGPVPSRRLGRSLGINNVPAKTCSCSCVHCRLGPTPSTAIEPRVFHDPAHIVAAVWAPDAASVNRAWQVFRRHLAEVEYEGHAFYLRHFADLEGQA